MAEGQFEVVFRGEITGDQPVEAVKQHLATLFRMPAERVEALFSGKPIVVKKNIDEATARKLEQAFQRAGAACEVRSSPDARRAEATTPPPADADASAAPAAAGGAASQASGPATGSIAAAGDPNRTLVDLTIPESFEGLEIDTSDSPLAPPDAQPTPEIDTTELTLADADSGPLSERRPPPPADIDTSDLSLEEPGD